jgi:hypothetical protein
MKIEFIGMHKKMQVNRQGRQEEIQAKAQIFLILYLGVSATADFQLGAAVQSSSSAKKLSDFRRFQSPSPASSLLPQSDRRHKPTSPRRPVESPFSIFPSQF